MNQVLLPPIFNPRFCPACGTLLEERLVEAEGKSRHICPSCSHIYYLNPKIVAGTIPVSDGRVWLLRRGIEPRMGTWTFPAGFMEMGETVEQAAIRETFEELSLEVELGPLIGIYSRAVPGNNVHVVYLAKPLNEPRGGEETLEYALLEPGQIPWDRLAFWSTEAALREWVDRWR
jgi:ADP-ribose pyrophosphatase YjhB (NUDIX family)